MGLFPHTFVSFHISGHLVSCFHRSLLFLFFHIRRSRSISLLQVSFHRYSSLFKFTSFLVGLFDQSLLLVCSTGLFYRSLFRFVVQLLFTHVNVSLSYLRQESHIFGVIILALFYRLWFELFYRFWFEVFFPVFFIGLFYRSLL